MYSKKGWLNWLKTKIFEYYVLREFTLEYLPTKLLSNTLSPFEDSNQCTNKWILKRKYKNILQFWDFIVISKNAYKNSLSIPFKVRKAKLDIIKRYNSKGNLIFSLVLVRFQELIFSPTLLQKKIFASRLVLWIDFGFSANSFEC